MKTIFILGLSLGFLPFKAFCADDKKSTPKKQQILDLGAINIKGEVRRPNIQLVYSKKHFEKALNAIAKKELRAFEKKLLKPSKGK